MDVFRKAFIKTHTVDSIYNLKNEKNNVLSMKKIEE